ncbi:hypothetical protein OIV83_005456 [Microbotryomycetes sp. JL201]|nr:hypothetical protein OIV83_005456 [Microbotryomycetes sp. JL201]
MTTSTAARLSKPLGTALIGFGGVWLSLLVACAVPPVQRSLIYLHQLRFPFGTDFDTPEQVGYAPGKVRNFHLETEDGQKIGVWHVLPDSVYDQAVQKHGVPNHGSLPESVFSSALNSPQTNKKFLSAQADSNDYPNPRATRDHPVVLYHHGNAATRAHSNRVRVGRLMSSSDQNFVIFDYRGFADSTGTPSEHGLVLDARTVWDHLVNEHGVKPEDITVMGQSLGTGCSSALVSQLAKENIQPHALVLVAPFSSIGALLETYRLFNVLPILAPFKVFPWLLNAALTMLHTRFDTKGVIRTIKCPILILHAQDDPVIPHSHSMTLAHHLLEPLLPAHTDHDASDELDETRQMIERDAHKSVTKVETLGRWGKVTTFERQPGFGKVTWAEAKKGAHNEIGSTEMSLKLIQRVLRAKPYTGEK